MEREEAEVKDILEEVRWRTRLWCVEKDDRVLRVDELGVEGVAIDEALLGRIGDERRRGSLREVVREYGWYAELEGRSTRCSRSEKLWRSEWGIIKMTAGEAYQAIPSFSFRSAELIKSILDCLYRGRWRV
jgi:hypothetical protein